jgi:CrcB protein
MLVVLIGGAAGTAARYALAEAWPTHPDGWPWGTFLANLAGCLILGLLLEGLGRRGPDVGIRQRARLLVGTGFCGGLTTYSTFAVEADLLVRAGQDGLALAYVAVSLVAGSLAAAMGILAAAGRRRPGVHR